MTIFCDYTAGVIVHNYFVYCGNLVGVVLGELLAGLYGLVGDGLLQSSDVRFIYSR